MGFISDAINAGVVGVVDTIWRFVLENDIRRRRAETLENGG